MAVPNNTALKMCPPKADDRVHYRQIDECKNANDDVNRLCNNARSRDLGTDVLEPLFYLKIHVML